MSRYQRLSTAGEGAARLSASKIHRRPLEGREGQRGQPLPAVSRETVTILRLTEYWFTRLVLKGLGAR